jgi:hypothetical protein
MNATKLKQAALVVALFGVAGFLFYFSTWTDERRIVLSQAIATGKVTYKGKPVPYALVIMTNNRISSTGAADADGNYTVANAPPGKVMVGVNTDAGRGMLMSAVMAAQQGGDKSAKPTFLDVPKKFFAPETSGLTVDIKDQKEPNSIDIDVK